MAEHLLSLGECCLLSFDCVKVSLCFHLSLVFFILIYDHLNIFLVFLNLIFLFLVLFLHLHIQFFFYLNIKLTSMISLLLLPSGSLFVFFDLLVKDSHIFSLFCRIRFFQYLSHFIHDILDSLFTSSLFICSLFVLSIQSSKIFFLQFLLIYLFLFFL